MLRDAAMGLTDYVISLQPSQLEEFWLPWTAHLLVSATTILLRCLLESADLATKRECALKLVSLKKHLQIARDESAWDLADFCLERCSGPINKIAAAMGLVEDSSTPSQPTASDTVQPQDTFEQDPSASSFVADYFFPVDSFDYPFDAFWDVNA